MKIKKWGSLQKYLKLIEVQSNVVFLSAFGIEVDAKNKRKRVFRMWKNAYLSIKTQKLLGPT